MLNGRVAKQKQKMRLAKTRPNKRSNSLGNEAEQSCQDYLGDCHGISIIEC